MSLQNVFKVRKELFSLIPDVSAFLARPLPSIQATILRLVYYRGKFLPRLFELPKSYFRERFSCFSIRSVINRQSGMCCAACYPKSFREQLFSRRCFKNEAWGNKRSCCLSFPSQSFNMKRLLKLSINWSKHWRNVAIFNLF